MLIIKKMFIVFIGIFCLCLFACDGGGDGDGDGSEVCYYDVDESNVDDGGIVWGDGRIFYPCDIENMSGKLDASTMSGGLFNTKTSVFWMAEYVTGKGNMIVHAVTASAFITTYLYEDAHKAAVYVLKSENANPNSPIYQKLGKIGLAGYSLGAGGALQAAHDMGDEISAVVAWAPYSTDPASGLTGVVAPSLCIRGTTDTSSTASMAHGTFEDLPNNLVKAYAEIQGVGHLYWVSNSDGELGKIMTLAWLKYYVSGDTSYYKTIVDPPSGIVNYERKN